jgi:glutamyl/glutaminyl-tRNA synthetase
VLLYEALGFAPPVFAHLALVMGPDHSPLSKRHGATSVAEFRSKGYLPEALVNYLALIGWSPSGRGNNDELLPVDELARRFALEDVGHSAGVFDEEKLAWVNRHYLKLADPMRLADLSLQYFNEAGVPMTPDRTGLEYLASAMTMTSASVDRLNQVPGRLRFLFDYDAEAVLRDPRLLEDMRSGGARAVVTTLADQLATPPARPRRLSRGREQGESEDRAERQGALPSDSARADRAPGRAGARSRGAGHRSGRGTGRVGRHPSGEGQQGAGGRVRARAGRPDP